MTKQRFTSYEELVAECKRLRAESEAAEVEFFLFLVIVERDHAPLLKAQGCETIDQFIRSNTLVKTERYHAFTLGLDRVGVDKARANGVHWTIEMGHMREPTKERIEDMDRLAQSFTEVRGVQPSEEAAKGWRRELDAPRTDAHPTIKAATRLRQLEAENANLRAELRAAKSALAKAEQKLAKLEAGKPGSTKEVRAGA